MLGVNSLYLAVGILGGILVIIILGMITFYIVCRVKGLTLRKREVGL